MDESTPLKRGGGGNRAHSNYNSNYSDNYKEEEEENNWNDSGFAAWERPSPSMADWRKLSGGVEDGGGPLPVFVVTDDDSEASIEEGATAAPDSMYGWVIVFAAFLIHANIGLVYSFGVLVVPLAESFHVGRGTVSWAGSILPFMVVMIAPLSGYLAQTYGYKKVVATGMLCMVAGLTLSSYTTHVYQIYITFGFVVGVGTSLSWIPTIGCTGQWFEKRIGLALGIAVAGVGAGNLCMPPILQALIDAYSWRVALRCMALYLLIANSIACALLKRRIHIKRKLEFWSIVTNKTWQLIFIMGALEAYGHLIPFYHIVAYAEDSGVSHSVAAWLLSAMGIASTFGRVILGYLGDKTSHLAMLKLSGGCLAVALGLWPFFHSVPTLLMFGCTFGFFAGSFVAVLPVVLSQLFGSHRMASVTGLTYSGFGIGNLLGPPVTGWCFDKTGTYKWGIWIGTIIMLISFGLLLFVKVSRYDDNDNTSKDEDAVQLERLSADKRKTEPNR